jgi:carboxylesterase type B
MIPQSAATDFLTLARIRHNTFELQENYGRINVNYKELNGTGIETAILVPKSLSTKKTTAPIIVHLHGGGLLVGTNLDPAFLSDWSVSSVWLSH